jgi:GNAT superfamily N-acetyltransferase
MLDQDRAWAAYAIGDLDPSLIKHCEWYMPAGGQPALLLLYRGFDPPILFAMGDPPLLEGLFAEIHAPLVSLHVRPEALPPMSRAYTATHRRAMIRMAITPARFRPTPWDDVQLLGAEHLEAVRTLYADGRHNNDGPTFFHPAMLTQRTFRGIWRGDTLVAIAGTHLYSRELGVCAIGNVYTRHDHRGRGLAARVTSAVVAHALSDGVATIVLNVGRENSTAQRVYRRLGFDVHCDFFEGEARRVT